MKLTKRQKIWSSGLSLAAIVFSWVVWSGIGMGDGFVRLRPVGEAETSHGLDVQLLPALELEQVNSLSRTVVHPGTVHSRHQTLVSFQRAGLIERLLIDEGMRVHSGQDLAVLDPRHLMAQQSALVARLQQANAVLQELIQGPRPEVIDAASSVVVDLQEQLNAQQLRLQRSEGLVNTNSISKQEYERELYAKRGLQARLAAAQSQLDELKAGTRLEKIEAQQALIQSLQADLQGVQFQLDDCHLKAPFDGMIVARHVDPGAVVTVGTPVVELIDDKNLEIHVGLPQALANQLQVGCEYRVFAGGHEFPAKLRTVLPQVDRDTRTSKAILDVSLHSDQPTDLVSGQLARVELEQRVPESGFWIPRLALTADHSGLWSCFVVQPYASGGDENAGLRGCAAKQSVEVLHVRDEWVFVRGTLQNGQLLICDGMHRIVPGQQVKVRIENSRIPGGDLSAATRTSPGSN